MGLKLDGYLRVSRIGGRKGEGYISPDVQREAIERKARELGGEIVAWHDDQDYSGGNVERPGFEVALDRLKEGATNGLVVKKVDRFARDVPDGSRVIREIGEWGGMFAACDEAIEHRPGDNPMMIHIHLTVAQDFLDRIKAGWITSKGRAIARGAHIGAVPIGYLKVEARPSKPSHISPVDSAARGGPQEPGRLVPHPDYGPAITELFERAATGQHGDTALARWMTERAPREGGREWQPSEIRRWLGTRVYLGEVRYGELSNPDAHEPLTNEATWNRCQREPGQRHVRRGGPFLLSGLARCANCRYAMTGQSRGGARQSTPVYRCNGNCDSRSVVVGARLEDHVRALVIEHLASMRLESAENGIDLERLDRELAEAEDDVRSYGTNDEARRLLGNAAWTAHLAELAAIRDAKAEAREDGYSRARIKDAAALDVDSLDGDGLRDLFNGLIRCLFVRRQPPGAGIEDRVLVIWVDDPHEPELPGPHRAGPFEPISFD